MVNVNDWLQRIKQRLTGAKSGAGAAGQPFALEEVVQRVQQLQPPSLTPAQPIHALIKLAPIPVPRAVRWEGHVVYSLAWLGTALLAMGAYWIPIPWLPWYGLVAVLVFALLFRLEGPKTRTERLQRLAHMEYARSLYHEAEDHLQAILHERFTERVQDFQRLCTLYQAHAQASQVVEDAPSSAIHNLLEANFGMTESERMVLQVEELEAQMMALVHELEGFSEHYKQEVDAAIMASHDARLAYWQARLDASVFTGEVVHHP